MAAQVLIIEDHPLVAEATGKLMVLATPQVQPTLCASAVQAIRLLDVDPDRWFRIFLDLDVPGAYGLSLAKEIVERNLAARTCVVSAFHSDEYISKIRQWRFLGYIVKTTPYLEFREAILGVLEGRPAFGNDDSVKRQAAVRLTRRQTELLHLIRRGLSSRQMAAALHLAEGTVNNQVTSILQALDAESRAHAVSRAIELGLLDTAGGGRLPQGQSQPLVRGLP